MTSSVLEYVQNLVSGAPTLEGLGPELAGTGSKAVELALTAFAIGLIIWLSARLRKWQAVREDGWYYLTPGLIAWFMLIGASLISLGTLAGGAVALRTGYYKPSLDRDGLVAIGMFAFFILGFGALALLSYVLFFRHKVRWNHSVIEKIAGRKTVMRVPWGEVQEVKQEKGADHLWVVADTARIKVWTHLNGVEQLIAVIDGDETALGLPRQINPTIEGKPRPDYAGSFHPEHH